MKNLFSNIKKVLVETNSWAFVILIAVFAIMPIIAGALPGLMDREVFIMLIKGCIFYVLSFMSALAFTFYNYFSHKKGQN